MDGITRHVYPWLHDGTAGTGWAAQVYADAIQRGEQRLAYAQCQGKMYSSYRAWAERLEAELAMLRRLAAGSVERDGQ